MSAITAALSQIDRVAAEGDLAPEPEFSQLYVIEPREGAEPAAINLGYTAYTNAAWMTDGQSIVCTGRACTASRSTSWLWRCSTCTSRPSRHFCG